jgi:hypothetical protein
VLHEDEASVNEMLNVMQHSAHAGEDPGGGFRLDEESDIDCSHGAQDKAGPPQKGNPST